MSSPKAADAGPRAGCRSGFACFTRGRTSEVDLMNALVGAKIAITSSRPQTTRRWSGGSCTGQTPSSSWWTRRPAQAAHAAGQAAGQPDARHADRGRRDRLLRPGRRAEGPETVPRARAGRDQGHAHRRDRDRTTRSPGQLVAQLRRWRTGGEGGRGAGSASPGTASTCWPACWCRTCPKVPRCTRRRTDRRARAGHGGRADPGGGPEGCGRSCRTGSPWSWRRWARPGQEDLTDVHAEMYVERPSEKAIVIGARGSWVEGRRQRRQPADRGAPGHPVYLDLRVKVAKDWQRNPKQLRRLSFYELIGRRQEHPPHLGRTWLSTCGNLPIGPLAAQPRRGHGTAGGPLRS